MTKTRHWVDLCQNDRRYFDLWERGGGPGQSNPAASTAVVKTKTVPQHPLVGTALKKLLAIFFITAKEGCGCESFSQMMDSEGPDWCLTNRDMILDRLEREAQKRRLPFSRTAAGVLLRWAHRNAEREFKKKTRS